VAKRKERSESDCNTKTTKRSKRAANRNQTQPEKPGGGDFLDRESEKIFWDILRSENTPSSWEQERKYRRLRCTAHGGGRIVGAK